MNQMTEQEVVQIMESSKSEAEWNRNALSVKTQCGGKYPPFWYAAIVVSGLAQRVAQSFGGTGDIQVIFGHKGDQELTAGGFYVDPRDVDPRDGQTYPFKS